MKVYFVGSHATGKTELARFVSRAYKLPLISEVARAVLAEMETNLSSIRADLDRAAEYQRKVFRLQVEAETGKDRFVSDRSFDNLAYAAINTCALAEIADPAVLRPYLDRVRTGVVFFCRPDPALLVADGVRAEISMESAMRVDAMVHLMLEQWSIPYVSVRGSDRQERRRLVQAVVGLARDRGHALEESRAMGDLTTICQNRVGRWLPVTDDEPGRRELVLVSRADKTIQLVVGAGDCTPPAMHFMRIPPRP